MRLKIAVSVVRFRPWAPPFQRRNCCVRTVFVSGMEGVGVRRDARRGANAGLAGTSGILSPTLEGCRSSCPSGCGKSGPSDRRYDRDYDSPPVCQEVRQRAELVCDYLKEARMNVSG